MAYMKLTMRSISLNCNMDVSVFYPFESKNTDIPTLYLLHGKDGMFLDWPLAAHIHQIAMEKELCVVMPTARDPFSSKVSWLGDYYRYIGWELPDYLNMVVSTLSRKRERHFIAGVGHGGYYAARIALNRPDYFFGAGCFEAPIDAADEIRGNCALEPDTPDWRSIEGSSLDLFARASSLPDGAAPRLYLCNCPAADVKRMREREIPCEEFTVPAHNWNAYAEELIKRLPISR